jgi:hypothetical protein
MAACPVCRRGLVGDMLKVYVSSKCQYCYEKPDYIMAFPCGHWSCEPCLIKLMGTPAPALAPAPAPDPVPDPVPAPIPARAEPNWQSHWSIAPFPEFTWCESRVKWVSNPDDYAMSRFELFDVDTGSPWTGEDTPPQPPGISGDPMRVLGRWRVFVYMPPQPLA